MTIKELLASKYGITVQQVIKDVLYLASISGKQRQFAKHVMRQSNQ